MFGLDEKIIERVLKEGMLLKYGKEFLPAIGQVSLIFHPILKKYTFVFGTCAENAGYVLLEDINITWKLK